MDEPPPDRCEICEEAPLERVLYPVAVHFKGSGFYSTDYGRGSRKPTKDGAGADDGGEKKKEKDKKEKAAEA